MEELLLGKAAKGRGGSVSEEAERIWSMLDELAEQNPDGYKRFVENNIREGKELFEPPVPYCCFRTKMMASKDRLYINICSYQRIRKPEPNSTVSTMAGDILQGFFYEGERVQCVAVAFHPDVVTKMKLSAEDEHDLVSMVIRFLQDTKKVAVSFEFERWTKLKFVGLQTMLSDISRLLHGMDAVSRVPDVAAGVPTLEQISRIARNGAGAVEESSVLPDSQRSKSSAPLVTEVSSTPTPTTAPVSFTHRIEIRPANQTRPKRAVFIAALPQLRHLSDVTVDVSKEDVVIKVADQPDLCLSWPVKVNERLAIASFTKSNQLVVKAPLL